MKKYLFVTSIAFLLSSCGSKEGLSSKLVDVTYVVISNTNVPFIDVTYDEADATGNSIYKEDWNVTGIGTFTKKVKIQRGFGAGLMVRHPNSKDWKLVILSSKGDTLKASLEPHFYPGTLSYYISSIDVTIN